MFYIDGINLKSIGNILCFVGIIIAIFGLFNTWYEVSYNFSGSGSADSLNTEGWQDILKIDGLEGIQNVHLYHTHQRVRISLASDVLEGGEVEDIVVGALTLGEELESIRRTVESKGPEIPLDVTEGAANVPDELDEIVLTQIHHVEHVRFTNEDLLRDGPSDGPSATNYQKTALRHQLC